MQFPCSLGEGIDTEDVKVVDIYGEPHPCEFQGSSLRSLSLQTARRALLSHCSEPPQVCCNSSKPELSSCEYLPHRTACDDWNYQDVEQISLRTHTQSFSYASLASHASTPLACQSLSSPLPQDDARVFMPAGELEHMQKKQAGKQFLLSKRLYSEFEREQARRKKWQSGHVRQMQLVKNRKEFERRIVEEELGVGVDLASTISTNTLEDRLHAIEWEELVLLEERQQKHRKAKETERYVVALRTRLREQMERSKMSLPSLCLCGTTVWDTDPNTCANNCVFYKNNKGTIFIFKLRTYSNPSRHFCYYF